MVDTHFHDPDHCGIETEGEEMIDMHGLTSDEIEMEIGGMIQDLDAEQLAGLCDDDGLVGEMARDAFTSLGGKVSRKRSGGMITTSVEMPDDEDE